MTILTLQLVLTLRSLRGYACECRQGVIKARSLYPLMQDDITEIDARLTSITEMDLLKRILVNTLASY